MPAVARVSRPVEAFPFRAAFSFPGWAVRSARGSVS